MPRFLRGILCVIETFRRYAREDRGKATLTCSELRRLLQGEFGDILQPRAIHALEENLSLLDVDSERTISFDEFVLAIFNFLNLRHLDTPSLRNSEPGQVSDSEEKEAGEERTDLPASRKPAHPQTSAAPEGDGGTSETQEPGKDAARLPSETTEAGAPAPEDYDESSGIPESPAQERERATGEPPVQDDRRHVSETLNIGTENAERSPEAQIRAGQKESARKTPSSETQMKDVEQQELQGSSAEKDTWRDSEMPGLSSEESSRNQPEAKEGAAIPGEEARGAESHRAEAFVDSRTSSAAPGTPGATGRAQKLAPLEKPPEGENDMPARLGGKPAQGETGCQDGGPEASIRWSEEGSCETPNRLAPEGGNRMQRDPQRPADPCQGSVQGAHSGDPEPPKQGAPDEDTRMQEVVVPWVGGEDAQLPEGHRSQDSEAKRTDSEVELQGRPEAQESTARGENRQFPDAENPGGLAADLADQVSKTQLPEKESHGKELKSQPPVTKKEEGGVRESPEALLKSPVERQIPASPVTHLKREEHATLEEEEGRPREQAGEGDDQQNPAKNESSSSVSQSGTAGGQRGLEPRSAERAEGPPGVQYHSPQKIVQQVNITQEGPQHQALGEQQGPPQRETLNTTNGGEC